MDQLNSLRNDFIHYFIDYYHLGLKYNGYSIVTDCLDIIEFLAFESKNIIWHNNEQYKAETQNLLSECRSVIEAYG